MLLMIWTMNLCLCLSECSIQHYQHFTSEKNSSAGWSHDYLMMNCFIHENNTQKIVLEFYRVPFLGQCV